MQIHHAQRINQRRKA